MTKTSLEFLLEVGFIIHEEIGYQRVFDFEFSHLNLGEDFLLESVSGAIAITRTGEGLLTQGAFTATVQATCARCLDDFNQPLRSEFSELFTFPSHADATTELLVPSNGKIDFAPLVREYLLLEVPISPICRPDCKGLCPQCGVNHNHEQCDCVIEVIDPRLEKLKAFLDSSNSAEA